MDVVRPLSSPTLPVLTEQGACRLRVPRVCALVAGVGVLILAALAGARAAEAHPSEVTTVRQILELHLRRGSNAVPARIHGVVTYADPTWLHWFLADDTGGVSLTRPLGAVPLEPGMEVEIEGEAARAEFAPTLLEHRVRILRRAPLPAPKTVPLDGLAGGRMDSQWVKMEGVVRSVSVDHGHLVMVLNTATTMKAYVPGISNGLPASAGRLVDSRIEVEGVCGTRFTTRGSLVDFVMFIPSLDRLRVIESGPAAPFELPLVEMASPLRYESAARYGHRIHVAGVVTARPASHEFFMQDASGGAWFQSSDAGDVFPGDRLEVVAFPEYTGATPSMVSSVFRRLGHESLPEPVRIDGAGPLVREWDCTRVLLEGEFIEVARGRADLNGVVVAGERRIPIRMIPPARFQDLAHLERGAIVAVTGVCVVDLDEDKDPVGIRILVSNPDDIRVVRAGPFWSAERGMALLGGVVSVLLAWGGFGLWREARMKGRYQLLFDHATDLVSTHDLDGRFVTANRAWESAAGFEPGVLLGERLQDLLPRGQTADWKSWWMSVVSGGAPSPREFDVHAARGRLMRVEMAALMVRDTRGRATVQCIGRDVTSRRREEQLRLQLETRLRHSEKMEAVGTLAGGIAHDFNNILAAILGNAEVMRMDLPVASSLQEPLTEILKSTERARNLVLQILTFSRTEQPERRVLRLGPVIAEALQLIRASLPSSIEIRTSLPETPSLVRANTTQVHQVLMNLCFNASHAMQGGPGRIDVAAEEIVLEPHSPPPAPTPALAPGRHLRVTVSDTGCGIDPRNLQRVFEPFFTTKGPGEGTGLGLAVVHGIMQSHHGAITVSSTIGQGASFHLFFPVVTDAQPAEEAPAPPDHAMPKGHGQRILVVDDEEAVAHSTARMLERLGYRPTVRTDPVEALELCRTSPQGFDLVLTDLTMPRLTGSDLACSLQASHPGLPIIVVTGHRSGRGGENLRVPGVLRTLTKPFTLETLAQGLQEAFGLPPRRASRPTPSQDDCTTWGAK